MPPLFQLDEPRLGYRDAVVLRDVSLNIAGGERVALVGASGAGKSTLLAALQRRYRTRCALVPQDAGLVRSLSVFHNIYIGSLARHSAVYNLLNLAWPLRREIDRVRPIAARLGLDNELFARAGELSGGQQQRTAVARALLQGGDAVLGDEPVSAVDGRQAASVLAALGDTFDTAVLALHDVELALGFCSRLVGLKNGAIVFDAAAAELSRADLDFLYRR